MSANFSRKFIRKFTSCRVDRFLQMLQDEVCFLRFPPGFPAVPQYFVHTSVGPGPSQNRACAIHAHGSSYGNLQRFERIRYGLSLLCGAVGAFQKRGSRSKKQQWQRINEEGVSLRGAQATKQSRSKRLLRFARNDTFSSLGCRHHLGEYLFSGMHPPKPEGKSFKTAWIHKSTFFKEIPLVRPNVPSNQQKALCEPGTKYPTQIPEPRECRIQDAEIYEKALSWLLTRLLWGD